MIYNSNGYVWNNYLPQQYLWDGTCGYHAITNVLNILHLLNDNNNNEFNELIKKYKCSNSYYTSNQIRNYFIYLNGGKKDTKLLDLKNVNIFYDKDNKIYYWDNYNDKIKIKSLINNKINGTFGIIIYHQQWWIKHWYSLVINIYGDNIDIHLLDSFSNIWSDKYELNNILKEIKLNVKWNNKCDKLVIYGYKLYQAIIFFVVFFVFFYGLIQIIHNKKIFE
jgi:hypothetical protein